MGAERRTLALLLLLFVASRVAWIHWWPASITYWEESSRWVAANEFLHGPFHPLLAYQADNYQAGSLVMTLATAAAMKVFGQSVFVFKAVSVAAGVATLGLLVAVARRAYGNRTAVAAAALYVAAPPLVAVWSLVQLGSHPEGLLFSLSAMLLFLRLGRNADDAPAWALFGVVTGAGLWFTPTTVFGPAACAAAWLLLYGLPPLRSSASAAIGALVGLAPWIGANLTNGGAGLERIAQIFGHRDAIDTWLVQSLEERLVAIVTNDFPRGAMLVAEPDVARPIAIVLAASCALLFAWALLPVVVRAARAVVAARTDPSPAVDGDARADTLFAVHSVLFFATMLAIDYSVSRPEPVHFRFYVLWLVPVLIPLAAALAGAGGGRSTGASPSRRRSVVLAVWLAVSAAATVRYVAAHADDHAPLASRAGYTIQGLLVYQKAPQDLAAALAFSDRIDDVNLRHSFDMGIGWGITVHVHSRHSTPGKLIEQVAALPPATRASIYTGLDWTLKRQLANWPDHVDPATLPSDERRYRFVLKALQRHVDKAFETVAPADQWRGKTPPTYPGYFPDDERIDR